jgi:uncharacterized protein (TIGR03437 family)
MAKYTRQPLADARASDRSNDCEGLALPAHILLAALVLICLPPSLPAQQDRITEAIDNTRRVVLHGNIDPRVQSASDQGRVDPSLVLPYVTLVLKPSAAQQADLDQLLAHQQDPSSPNYHRWLTPGQYADRFGASPADINKIVSWLGEQHFTVLATARGRNQVSFTGTAGQIESAFATEIHYYQVDSERHFANATDPSIPAAFQSIVAAIRGLHDFRLKPRTTHPRDTLFNGIHELAPGDIAVIYDINPLYQAGIDGAGQKLVIAGQTQINMSDVEQFRSYFGLPANNPQTMLVPGTTDPGISQSDLTEANLDLEWSGGVAPNATILYVYSNDVMDAVQYAIDQDLAPVVSVSYGLCEQQASGPTPQTFQQWAQQGNAEGITWFAASGDAGAADCWGGTDPATNNSKSVDTPGSVPEVTSVGGTEFTETSSYWSSTDNSNHASALSYMPETAWNDSVEDGIPSASGGGASIVFSKPSWQTGDGVPNDGARDVPDVSISASADNDGYEIFLNGVIQVVGGTSVGPVQFAGVAAMLNQYLVANGIQTTAGLGNMNPRFYALAQTAGVFHDITTGNNVVNPCEGQRNCTATSFGYYAGPGYDQVTGIGSVDIYNLVLAWHGSGSVGKGTVSVNVSASAGSIAFTGSSVLTATVKGSNGGTPTGTVSFSLGSVSLGTATLVGSNGSAVATLNVNGYQLAAGLNTITAQYSGDNSYDGASATASITITSTVSGTAVITSLLNGASFTEAFAPGGVLSVFGTLLAPATGSALAVPLPAQLAGVTATVNSVPAPFYYVSPTQLNIQIPYATPANSTAILQIDNNGHSIFANFQVSAAAPGIFTYLSGPQKGAPVPYNTGARGQEVVVYITGYGAVSPTVATGAAPAAGTPLNDLPKPVGNVIVTVGNVPATIDFVGIPTWAVGVLQINYTIPPEAPLGAQPVAVSVGTVASVPATLTVTP